MHLLSLELYLTFLEYLNEKEKISWCICCKRWYYEVLRNYVRILRIHVMKPKWSNEKKRIELLEKIPRMIKDPVRQLEIYLDSFDPNTELNIFLVLELFESINYSLRKLSCSIQKILELSTVKEDLSIRTTIFTDYDSMDEFELYSLTLQDSLQVEQKYQNVLRKILTPNLKELNFRYNPSSQLFSMYVFLSRLKKLSLTHCEISDVSMLGSIPNLSLKECHNITDISALHDNEVLEIYQCTRIMDYSHSFENTKRIYLDIFLDEGGSIPIINSHHWKKVRSLKVCYHHYNHIPVIDMDIPSTALDCHISRVRVTFPVSPLHKLRELNISCNDSVVSLENFGLENLVVIELYDLNRLSSLRGLGFGRNQKVIVTGCPMIQDYFPLRYVHEVAISTSRSVRLDELDHVTLLQIKAKEIIFDPNHSYNDISQLSLSVNKPLTTFNGLTKIPTLVVDDRCVKALILFLTNEGKLFNNKIMISAHLRSKKGKWAEMLTKTYVLYVQYLSEEYKFFNTSEYLILVRTIPS